MIRQVVEFEDVYRKVTRRRNASTEFRLTETVKDLWTEMLEVAVDQVLECGRVEAVELFWGDNDEIDTCHFRAIVDVWPERSIIGSLALSARWICARRGNTEGPEPFAELLRMSPHAYPEKGNVFVDSEKGDDRETGDQDRPLKTFAEHLRRVRWPRENEVYIRESGPWGPRVRCTDRYRVTTGCPEMLG
jgi:hypothetical protein